jgi:hypothetical protein
MTFPIGIFPFKENMLETASGLWRPWPDTAASLKIDGSEQRSPALVRGKHVAKPIVFFYIIDIALFYFMTRWSAPYKLNAPAFSHT